jgi:hypothetical protein
LDELISLVKKHGYTGTGRLFNCSDNAIRKRIMESKKNLTNTYKYGNIYFLIGLEMSDSIISSLPSNAVKLAESVFCG